MGGNKFLLLGGIVLLSFLAAGCVQQGGLQFDNQTAQATATPSLTAAEQELLKYPELAGYLQAYQNIGTPAQRPDYLPSVVFSKLPPFPKDFYSIALLVRLGKFTDMNNPSSIRNSSSREFRYTSIPIRAGGLPSDWEPRLPRSSC